jgi:hypothetical protein
MPELVNNRVGSLLSTKGADGTILWPLLSKNSRNLLRICRESMPLNDLCGLLGTIFIYIYGFKIAQNVKINGNWSLLKTQIGKT